MAELGAVGHWDTSSLKLLPLLSVTVARPGSPWRLGQVSARIHSIAPVAAGNKGVSSSAPRPGTWRRALWIMGLAKEGVKVLL
ncbi:hypothetical protein E2C01_053770 [Portunus trituberculatus]|uniref:Uncharacterized protein n=1 Tax=Portunus trituberculatus TaxID=210409 RepID=A0A5B7GL79_PORTR|nr:hypothetical protein [Portunus trituberculatus]